MKFWKRVAIAAAGLGILYYLSFGLLYLAGFRVYRFPTAGMQPTIQNGEMAVGRLSDGYRDKISRFDIAVYNFNFQGSNELYAKRVIGLPGERITIDALGVKINGQPITLPNAVNLGGLKITPCDLKIPSDAIFVLGDNTANSVDSRYHVPTPKKDVVGHLVFKK